MLSVSLHMIGHIHIITRHLFPFSYFYANTFLILINFQPVCLTLRADALQRFMEQENTCPRRYKISL